MTLYLKKLSFIESYPFKSQGKRYYHDIQRDKITIKFQLDLDTSQEILNTLQEEKNTNHYNNIYQDFLLSLKNKEIK